MTENIDRDYAYTSEPKHEVRNRFRLFGAIVLILLLLQLIVGWWWSREPALFPVRDVTNKERNVVGDVTLGTMIRVAETLLDKSGGYIANDVTPPGVFLDNMPSWEFGVLVQIRDLSEVLRDDLSRSQSQSSEDKDLKVADPLLKFEHKSWILPSTEGEYRTAIKHLKNYRKRLFDSTTAKDAQKAEFYARADNLNDWLNKVSKRLGSLSQRLSSSVGRRAIHTNLAGNIATTDNLDDQQFEQTPWLKIDNELYEARGTTWALYHLLKAAQIDFAEVLEDKGATASLDQIIRELEATQQTLWSPVVLNGGGMGVLANHSLVMANYISRANAAIMDLRGLLARG
ncbi:MAG: DUF2333 family protein [Pseudomonadota bacterium]